jgi:hypothetical protein
LWPGIVVHPGPRATHVFQGGQGPGNYVSWRGL